MKYHRTVAAVGLCASVLFVTAIAQAQAPEVTAPAARSGAASAMALGPQHAALAGYVGRWNVEMVLSSGDKPIQHSKGKAEYSWVITGRWLGCHIVGTMLGAPYEQFTIMGYDGYAQNVVEVSVESADNSMLLSRGPSDDVGMTSAALFGELDEYTTGILHRPYKVILHRLTADRHVIEIWGLDSSTNGTRKLTFNFTRAR
jgi:hypothetical protein